MTEIQTMHSLYCLISKSICNKSVIIEEKNIYSSFPHTSGAILHFGMYAFKWFSNIKWNINYPNWYILVLEVEPGKV